MATLKNPGFKKLTLKNLLTIIGGVIIFVSWVVQQHQSDTSAKKELLKRSQLVVDIEEVQRSVNEINYTEQLSKNPVNTTNLAIAQTNLANSYMRLLTWSKGRIDDTDTVGYTKLVNLKNKLDSENRFALLAGHYTIIDSNFNSVLTMFGSDFKKLDNQYSWRYHNVEENDDRWSFWFIISYGLGSLIVGVSYLLKGE